MHLGPLLRALMRNLTGALLIAAQIAFTLAVCINAYVMIEERLNLAARASGIVEDELFHLTTTVYGDGLTGLPMITEDLAAIRETPGVVDAVQMNAIPLSGSGWSMGLQTEPGADADGTGVAVYMVDQHGISTLGVELIAGRDFREEEVRIRRPGDVTWPDNAILTRSAVETLFPDDPVADVAGRNVFINNDHPMKIVGIIDKLQAPWSGSQLVERSILVPERMDFGSSHILVRAQAAERDRLIPVVEDVLAARGAERLVRNVRSMTETRQRSYQIDVGLTRVLQIVMIALLVITALGILGLTSFNVRRRTKQIGTRRALGATRGDVVAHFLAENMLIAAIGVVLGVLLAVAFNLWLVEALGFPKIAWTHVAVGALALFVLSQIATLAPAYRASSISPAVATRTV
ncbi:MAG: FtsX-like permease family protein [Pseudomonadota bacterium]